MRQLRHLTFVLIVIAAGAIAMSILDWERERKAVGTEAIQIAESMVELISLYPLHDMDLGTRNLLTKTLVEQSGMRIAYLHVMDASGRTLLDLGSSALQGASAPTTSLGSRAVPHRRLFPAPDGAGQIIEYIKPFSQHGQKGAVRLGLRLETPPFISRSRISSVASVVFLMLAALIVGYYTIVLSLRRSTQPSSGTDMANAVPGWGGTRGGDNVLRSIQEMNERLTGISNELHETNQRNANLSSSLGVARFEVRQAYRIFDGLDSGLLILSLQGKIVRVNQAMLELLGCSVPAIAGKSYGEAIQHEDIVNLLDEYTDSGGSRSSIVETQFSETAPDKHFRLNCHPLWDATGDAIGSLVTAEDITRMKVARKTQDDFIGEVVHELMTPLTSLKSYSELLMSGDVRDETTQREFYNTINSETDRLTLLVRNLLNVSKMETGSLSISRGVVKTDWLLDQCMPAIEATATGKNISIAKQLPDVFPTIMGDKELLKVVLVNILGNAVKYTPQDGSIHVSLRVEDNAACFEVKDSGPGIPPEDQPRIFEKFYRGQAASVRDEIGSGIGLSTAMRIAKLHGGGIDVTSQPGDGSCFTVRIPTEEYTLEKR